MSGAFSFDPDRFVPRDNATEPTNLFDVPASWAHGLTLLRERHRPPNADESRWKQLISDATKLATIWSPQTLAAGWSIEALFGFDPAEWRIGLAVALQGRRLLKIAVTHATIIDPPGWAQHHPHMPPGAPLIWNFDERRLSR